MLLLTAALVVIAVFLLFTLLAAVTLSLQYGDSTASYHLFRVRDKAIDAVVFGNVERDDPWFEYLYSGLDSILTCCNAVKGPEQGWKVGKVFGRKLAQREIRPHRSHLPPSDIEPSPELIQLFRDFDAGLKKVTQRHMGLLVARNAYRREREKIQRDQAKAMRESLRKSGISGLCLS